jgi:ribosomal protein S18 acetylase RimI-like enzyme
LQALQVSETPPVEIATAKDIAALGELRLRTGWYASTELLGALVAWEHASVLLVRARSVDPGWSQPDEIIASTSAIAAGQVGVIGNVVVDAGFRRRGLARITTSAALEWLRDRQVSTVLLDATRDGRPLYTQLGFLPVGRSWYVRTRLDTLDQRRLVELAGAALVETHSREDLPRTSELDRRAFGGDRSGLLALMLQLPHNWLVIARESPDGDPAGYLIYGGLRDTLPLHTHPSIHLGPLIARNQAAAAALLLAVARDDAPWRQVLHPSVHSEVEVRASMSGVAHENLEFYRASGLELHEDDVLMQLDLKATIPAGVTPGSTDRFKPAKQLPPSPYPGDPRQVYAWLAPMTF